MSFDLLNKPLMSLCVVALTFLLLAHIARSQTTYTVTPIVGANGSLEPSTAVTVTENATTSFSVSADTGYMYSSYGGTCKIESEYYPTVLTVGPVTEDCTVEVKFRKKEYKVTVTAETNGFVGNQPLYTQPGETWWFTVLHGGYGTLDIRSEYGFTTDYVGGSCGGTLSSFPGGTYTTNPITSDCTVLVFFRETTWHGCKEVQPYYEDEDNDLIESRVDNCPEIANSTQSDVDKDGTGDVCDTEDNRTLTGGLSALTDIKEIQLVYVGLLGRAADRPGFDYWRKEIANGEFTIEDLRHNIVHYQPEYLETLGLLPRYDLISGLYLNLFSRLPDTVGHDYWATGGGSSVAVDRLVLALLNGAGQSDTATLLNKAEAALHYTDVYSSYVKSEASRVIQSVDSSMASVESAKKSACDY